jgi:hypothetical protein
MAWSNGRQIAEAHYDWAPDPTFGNAGIVTDDFHFGTYRVVAQPEVAPFARAVG